MERVFMRVLACCMIAVLLFCNVQMPVYAAGVSLFSSKDNLSESDTQTQEEKEESTEEEESTLEDSTKTAPEESEELTEEVAEATERTEEQTESPAEEIIIDLSEEASEEIEEDTEVIENTEVEISSYTAPTFKAASPNHKITMPDLTSQYFWLQKGSEDVAEATGSHLTILKNEKAVSQYMTTDYPDGDQYNFVPHLTDDTVVAVGGGASGGVALSTIAGGNASSFGDLYRMYDQLQTKAYNLEKCTSDPYAIYTNVGTWYDKEENKTYAIDMKLTIKDYTYPDKSIRDTMAVTYYDAPYAAFTNHAIGVVAIGCDTVETEMEFYYHGTTTPVERIKGMVQFIDIDAQQGVDIADGFQDVILFNTDQTHIRYNSNGTKSRSIGYVSSGTHEAFNYRNVNTTALGIFSGAVISCVWSIARCDQSDTGGSALFGEAGGYKVPLEEFGTICYSNVRSTGFLGIDNDIALISLPPQVTKNIYHGKISEEKSSSDAISLSLENRDDTFTYVVSAASEMPTDISKAYYKKYVMTDMVDELLEVTEVKVYAGVSESASTDRAEYADMTDSFIISTDEQTNHKTKVEVSAKESALKESGFYGNSYYIHIQVHVRSNAELAKRNLSIEDWYQTDNSIAERVSDDGNYKGTYAVTNKANLSASSSMDTDTELITEETAVKIPMRILVKKTDAQSKKPVEGVVFGLFGGDAIDYNAKEDTPILTATTNEEGVAEFAAITFYEEAYGDGPYFIKELSVPEKYENIWDKEAMESWSYEISSLKSSDVVKEKQATISIFAENENKISDKQSVRVLKKNKETGKALSGAEFTLYEWSETDGSYRSLMTLTEGSDEGSSYYYNGEPITNTFDNLGKYKIMETKAPAGCVLTGAEWLFQVTDSTKSDGSDIVYVCSSTEEKQTGQLTYENPLQKGILEIIKNDESGNPLEGVSFEVSAANDIYAPWDISEDGTPKRDAVPLVKEGTMTATVTTDSEGKAKSEALYIGDYHVKEIDGASGYIMSDETYTANLAYGTDDSIETVSYTLNVSNRLMKPAVNVAKLADKTMDAQGTTPVLDAVSGRYLNERVAGTYEGEEDVDYTITVTNTGNVTIYQVTVTDEIGNENENGKILSDYIEAAAYNLPADGILTSRNGKKVQASISEEKDLQVVLDALESGDSVEIHLLAKVKKEAGNAYHLKNDVFVKASYYNKESSRGKSELKEVEEGIKEDTDYINIPGTPEASVAKMADKTTGIALENGRYEGQRTEGVYEIGDAIDFTITVSNTGTAPLYQIVVDDVFSDDLKKVVDLAKVEYKEGTIETANGKKAAISVQGTKEEGEYSFVIDTLSVGDSVTLHLTSEIKSNKDVPTTGIANTVQITAKYDVGDGTKQDIPATEKMKDEDTIGVKSEEEATTATTQEDTTKKEKTTSDTKSSTSVKEKTAKSTSSVKTGDDNPLFIYIGLCIGAAGAIAYLLKKKKYIDK